jgi:hypothetical protein
MPASQQRPSPKDTFAVVIGIEHYEDDRLLADLDGPARDAASYVEWLRKSGVPADHISAFVSPLATNQEEIQYRFGACGVRYMSATHDAIHRVFLKTLPALRGDTLVVLWGGHGMLADANDRRLFYGDASAGDPRNLSFDSLQRLLVSETYAGFPSQLILIDSCANYLEDVLSALEAPADVLPADPGIANVTQSMLFAAAAGEQALNTQRAGAFSSAVLELLRVQPTFLGDLSAVRERLREHFASLQDVHSQTPAFYTWQTGPTDRSTEGIIPGAVRGRAARRRALAAGDVTALAQRLAVLPSLARAEARSALAASLPLDLSSLVIAPAGEAADAERFATNLLVVVLARDAADALFDVLEHRDGTVKVAPLRTAARGLIAANEARNVVENTTVPTAVLRRHYLLSANDFATAPLEGGLERWIEALAEMPARAGVTPLSKFVFRLQRENPSPALQAWFEKHVPTGPQRADVERSVHTAAYASRPYLAIMLRTHDLKPGEKPEIEGWLWRGDDVDIAKWKGVCAPQQSAIEQTVLDLVKWAKDVSGLGLDIEFLLPRGQLGLAPEHWRVPSDDEVTPDSTLGVDHTVVVRWRERVMNPQHWETWRRRHAAILQRVAASVPDVWWVETGAYDFFSLRHALMNQPAGGDVLSMSSVPLALREADLLGAALTGGAPFVCFPHRTPPECSALRTQLERIVSAGLPLLRGEFGTWRQREPALGGCFSLLWDDPAHEPLPHQLTQPI